MVNRKTLASRKKNSSEKNNSGSAVYKNVGTQADDSSPRVMEIDQEKIPLIEISKEGNLILDVTFQNSQDCTKSIPKDALRHLKHVPPSVRILYRVKLEFLQQASQYFRLLLSSRFAEGIAVQTTLQNLSNSGQDLSKVDVESLPRTKIVDEDFLTKTVGRENIFGDVLRVIHGLGPKNTPYTTHFWTVLVLLADKYDVVPCISRYLQKACLGHSYRITSDKNGEEVLRQKILIQYHMEKGPRFTLSTKDLIIRGSTLMIKTTKNFTTDMKGAWWDLPYGIESEIAYRRACVLRTVASIQNQFFNLYSSRELQCKLGYDSSTSCDSFQIGETVKFLSRNGLLFLMSFQPALSEESESLIWPEAYTGNIDELIKTLRECPSYQIDKNHHHCGFRSLLLPALDYIQKCLNAGLGIRLSHGDGPNKSRTYFASWQSSASLDLEAKPVWVNATNGQVFDGVKSDEKSIFQFAPAKQKMSWSMSECETRELFTSKNWNWIAEQNVDCERLGTAFGVMR